MRDPSADATRSARRALAIVLGRRGSRAALAIVLGRRGSRAALATALSTLAASASAGCTVDAAGTTAVPTGDLEAFRVEVQPVLASACGSSPCHGRVERPLEIYSPRRHRLDPDELFLRTELAPEEVEANARNVAAFSVGAPPAASLVLRKPLAADEGGVTHGGGVVWSSRSDRGYRAVRRWIEALVPGEAE